MEEFSNLEKIKTQFLQVKEDAYLQDEKPSWVIGNSLHANFEAEGAM